MKINALPETVLLEGAGESRGTITFVQRPDNSQQEFCILIWSNADKANQFLTAVNEPKNKFLEIERNDLFQYLMDIPWMCDYVVYNLDPKDVVIRSPSFRVDALPQDKIVKFKDIESKCFVTQQILMHKIHAPDTLVSAALRYYRKNPELTPIQVIGHVAELRTQAEYTAKEEAVLERTNAEYEGALKNLEKMKIQEPYRTAYRKCPPPASCPRCGESGFQFISLAPSTNAATWKCRYCGGKELVRADQLKAKPSAAERSPIPKDVQREVWQRDKGRCVECGSKENLEYDHIIPISKGGANTVRNLQLLCQECNRRKSGTDPGCI